MRLKLSSSLSLFIILILSVIIGCSSKEPISTSDILPSKIQSNPGILVSDYKWDGTPESGFGFIGLYEILVDVQKCIAEITPLRNISHEDVLEEVDITNFLKIAPCQDCVKLKSIGRDSYGNVILGIGIKHPFGVGDPLKPITGRNRADLHVFNVEGIVVSDGTSTPLDFPLIKEKVGNLKLANADGYTKYLDNSLDSIFPTISTIHPYILHFDDYSQGNFDVSNPMGFASVTNPPPSGNLVMPMGADYDFQDYVFSSLDTTSFRFAYAVGCTYAVSAEKKQSRFNPEYRVPQHNKKAASEVKVEIVSNQLRALDTSSQATLDIKVLDINHGVEVGSEKNQMRMDSSVSQISIEVPTLMTSPLTITSPMPTGGNGRDPSNPLNYRVQITNSGGANSGVYTGLVKVLDSYLPGQNVLPILKSQDGIRRVEPTVNPLDGLFSISEFATYQIFNLQVVEGSGALTCKISTNPTPPIVVQGEKIIFDGSSSSGSNPITTYEWDFDYDGVNFDVDDTGAIVEKISCKVGTRVVALRIKDIGLNSAICTVEITVNYDSSIITGWGSDINLGGSPQGVQMSNMGFRGIATYGSKIYINYWDWSRTNGSAQIWCLRSDDYGQTWGSHVQVTNYPGSIACVTRYPSIWVDKNTGYVYIAYETNAPSLLIGGIGTYDIAVTRSINNGQTWSTPIYVSGDPSCAYYEYWPSITIDDSVSPSRLYITFCSMSNPSNYNIQIARTTTANFTNWTLTTIDDPSTSIAAYHNCVRVNPIDKAVMVVWCDPRLFGGNGSVRFDRSADFGATWGTDVVIRYDASITAGAYNPVIAINPSTGVPGVLWREADSSLTKHYFSKANNSSGSSWGTPVLMDSYSSDMARAGSLDVSGDGHWICVTSLYWQIYFRQSLDDGSTWSSPINIADGPDIYDPNAIFDECKNVHIVWSDARNLGSVGTTEVFYDRGS